MNQKTFIKAMFVAVIACSSLASAAEAPAVASKPDPVKGEALFTNGDATRNIVACMACHGAAGNSVISQNPKLAGQHAAYLTKQLNNFTGPTRKNAIMTAMATSLNPADMANVAAYLSLQTPQPGAATNQELMETGKKIYRAGIAAINVPACAGCHSPNGAGIPAQYPRLAGQHQDYIIAQLTSFRNGTRSNSVQMTAISARMTDQEMKAVADYVAGLK